MKNWTDSPREDLNIIPQMQENGWEAIFNYRDKSYKRTTPENVPHFSVSFKKGVVHLWQARFSRYEIKWRKADSIDGNFRNHSWVDSPLDLLIKTINHEV